MAHNYEYRFEIKPGKFVYVQRPDAILRGRRIIKRVVHKYAPSAIFFHMGRRGGHVAALRIHQNSTYFSRFDITNFFGTVTRSKLGRALRRIGFSKSQADQFAVESVVVEGTNKVVPFGFCQSPLMATLVLERSLVGVKLKEIAASGLLVSVYMDDILISGDDEAAVESASQQLIGIANESGFPLSNKKFDVAVGGVDIFNCHLKKDELMILDHRMTKLVDQYARASEIGQMAIEKYIEALSPVELARFQSML